MIFEENYFSRYILLNDHFSLSDGLYFLRYYAICENPKLRLSKRILEVGPGIRYSGSLKKDLELISDVGPETQH